MWEQDLPSLIPILSRDAQQSLQVLPGLRELQLQGLHHREVLCDRAGVRNKYTDYMVTIYTECCRQSILPIVMGARPEDYDRVAPHHSYIHVDQFRGPRHLAEYLDMLDKDDEKYNEYFQVRIRQDRVQHYTRYFSGKELESLSTQDSSAEYVPCFTTLRYGQYYQISRG